MALNYMAVIGHYHPTVVCHCFGDPDVYENIEWVSGDALPSQATLDAQKLALNQLSESKNSTSYWTYQFFN